MSPIELSWTAKEDVCRHHGRRKKIRVRVVLDQSNVTQLHWSWVNFLNLFSKLLKLENHISVCSLTRTRKIVMIAGCSALSLCYYKGLTPKLHFHWEGEYLKIKDLWCTWSGSPTHLLLSRCTWHQKMAIAWDEVVRDWRDMAPGLVFCDTGFLCSAVFFRGTRLHIHPRHP